jgi:hypothetical protein
MVFYH